VPEWHTQSTVYAEQTGERVATAFVSDFNAHLIAAAPDLLQALTTLLAHSANVNTAFYGSGKPKDVRAAMDGQKPLLQQARAAIAKATAGA
jgi:hypothetical protein